MLLEGGGLSWCHMINKLYNDLRRDNLCFIYDLHKGREIIIKVKMIIHKLINNLNEVHLIICILQLTLKIILKRTETLLNFL